MTNLPSHEYVAAKIDAYTDTHDVIYDVELLAAGIGGDPNWVAEAVPELAGLLDDYEVISYESTGGGGSWTGWVYYLGEEVLRLDDQESP